MMNKIFSFLTALAVVMTILAGTAHAGMIFRDDAHAPEHDVGGGDAVFPADPNADRLYTWDDTAGEQDWGTFTDFSYSGTAWTRDADTIGTSEIDLSISPSWTGYHNFSSGEFRGPESTVSSLPAAASNTGKIFIVTDGNAADDCTTGSGSSVVICRSNGSAYEAIGDGGSGSDTNSVKSFVWPASALLPLEAGDSIPPITKDAGTNIDLLTVSFNDSTDECRTASFEVPDDVDTSGTATFRVAWYSQSATSGNVIWDFRWHEVNEGESWDAALTTDASAADAVQGTVDQVTETEWTETLSNLGWTAEETVNGQVCRDADNVSDTLSGDAEVIVFIIQIPRA